MSLRKLICIEGRLLTQTAVRAQRVGPEAVVAMIQVYRNKYSCCSKKGSSSSDKALTMETVNPQIVKLEYAVRGPLVIRALALEKELAEGGKKSFNEVIKANIGDAHAMEQQPITFIRQVLACVVCPAIIDKVDFPEDVKKRACTILEACGGGSVGIYTASCGLEMVRKSVAEFIACRDGQKCDSENICLCCGASTGIKNVLQLFCNNIGGKPTGVMIPIPQYPLYSATLTELGLSPVSYYLDEDSGWALDQQELERAHCEGSKENNVRALVVINPGNPTGQVLTRENIEMIVKFAKEKKLFIFADEVYQDNVYAEGSEFHSFKKVTQEMGEPYSKMEVASFMTASKGYMGECGLRGGWMELINLDPGVQANLYKAASAMLCPPSVGQIVMNIVANPPKKGEPSFELFCKEKKDVLCSLAERANMIVETFNKMEGFKCNEVQGAMYAFPRITIPGKAIEAAKKENKLPDVYYAFRLLEETGVCIVPGSGFGQKPGTYHFRTTILPQKPLLKEMLSAFQAFHSKFTKEFS